uniref:LITAF domain-containing protein n=1 Tax=Panagrolaimus sp. PS1159 TaxID=55785 RepID=A0AC35F2V0_9BILA
MVIPVLGPYPMSIKCPHCYVQTFSEVNYSSGLATYLLSGGCCLLGGALGCFLIPFCLDSAKDVHHFCPHCRNFIGRYKRIG